MYTHDCFSLPVRHSTAGRTNVAGLLVAWLCLATCSAFGQRLAEYELPPTHYSKTARTGNFLTDHTRRH